MKTANTNSTQTDSKAVANVGQATEQPMVMGDWKDYVGNGEVINNFSVPVQVWNSDIGVYRIPAGARSETWGEDVDHVRDGRGNWWKIGWNTAVVDSNGSVSGALCRTSTFGVACPDEEIENEGGTGGPESSDAGVPQPGGVQPKLTTNQPNDRFEQEADAVAERVVSGETAIQRKCTDCEQEDELQMKPLVQMKTHSSKSGQEVQPWVQQQIEGSRGNGQPLRDETQSLMENGIGANFEEVKVHTDSNAVQMNRELGARAFTVGNDIYFDQNQFQPESNEGKRLLAHELTHTVQQGNGVQRMVQRDLWRNQRIPSGSKVLGPGITMRWSGNSVRISANIEVSGPEATASVASQIEASIENHWNASFNDGYSISCNANVSYRDEGTDADSSKTQIIVDDLSGPSNVTHFWLVGSRYMNYDISADINWTPAHEFGHLLALPDHYSEGIISKISGRFGGERENTVDEGWDGNIMAVHGGSLEQKNVEELLDLHATEIVTVVEDMYDEAARGLGQIESSLRRGQIPF